MTCFVYLAAVSLFSFLLHPPPQFSFPNATVHTLGPLLFSLHHILCFVPPSVEPDPSPTPEPYVPPDLNNPMSLLQLLLQRSSSQQFYKPFRCQPNDTPCVVHMFHLDHAARCRSDRPRR